VLAQTVLARAKIAGTDAREARKGGRMGICRVLFCRNAKISEGRNPHHLVLSCGLAFLRTRP
jgi:hypothetical protein